jgi:hypothetical protein
MDKQQKQLEAFASIWMVENASSSVDTSQRLGKRLS